MKATAIPLLAELSATESVIVIGAALVVLIIAFAGVMAAYRRKMRAVESADFGIDDVDRLHRQGLISDEEFSRLRRKALKIPGQPQVPPGQTQPPADGSAGDNQEKPEKK